MKYFSRRDFLRFFGAGTVAATAALALTGCAKHSDEVEESSTSDGNSNAGTETTVDITNEAQAESDVKVEAWSEKDATETATYHTNSSFYAVMGDDTGGGDTLYNTNYMLFDSIIAQSEEGEMGGWLAESFEINDADLTCTFHIRDNVYFTNGDKLTAEDVAFTLENQRTDTVHIARDNNVRPYLDYTEATDELTCVVHFTKPMPEFYYQFCLPTLRVYSKKAYEAADYDVFRANPVGTGPYTIGYMDGPNSIIDFELRTDDNGYWAYKEFGTYTNIKTFQFRLSPEATTRVSSMRTGDCQIISNVPSTDVETLENAGCYVYKVNPSNTVFLQFSCAPDRPFGDRNLREAVSLAIDREAIVDALLDGYGIPSFYPCRETDSGYDEAQAAELGYKYDPERAKELVEQSSYDGETLKFIYNPNTVSIANELTAAIQSMCASVGINMEISPMETAIYDEERTIRDHYDLCLGNTAFSVTCWYKPAGHIIGNDQYNTGFVNEELTNLAHELQGTMDSEEQDRLFKAIYKEMLTDFQPIIHLYWPVVLYAWNKDITGVKFHHYKNMDLSSVVWNK